MANDVLVCKNCTGTYFTRVMAEQYISGGFGTSEFRSVSISPKSMLMCIGCGSPVTPKPGYYARGTGSDKQEQDFRTSIELGQKHRETNSIQNVANIAAPVSDIEDLKKNVHTLVVDVSAVTQAVAALKAEAKPKGKKASPAEQ